MSEIIIDGVNVAECSYFTDNKECFAEYSCEWGEITEFSKCNELPNCYYKQLKRLEAENEKLKDKAYKDADMIYQLTEENREYDIDLSIEKEAHKSTIERLDKYHKTLEDIREIANSLKSTHCANCSQVLNNKGKCTADCMKDYKEKIFDKINEVLNEG